MAKQQTERDPRLMELAKRAFAKEYEGCYVPKSQIDELIDQVYRRIEKRQKRRAKQSS